MHLDDCTRRQGRQSHRQHLQLHCIELYQPPADVPQLLAQLTSSGWALLSYLYCIAQHDHANHVDRTVHLDTQGRNTARGLFKASPALARAFALYALVQRSVLRHNLEKRSVHSRILTSVDCIDFCAKHLMHV